MAKKRNKKNDSDDPLEFDREFSLLDTLSTLRSFVLRNAQGSFKRFFENYDIEVRAVIGLKRRSRGRKKDEQD